MSCHRCGDCCQNVVLTIDHIKFGKDPDEWARWLSYHNCEPLNINGKLGIKILNPCQYYDSLYGCKIYPTRPKICRDYLCREGNN